MSRVVFYSVEDGASGKNLEDAELLLKTVDTSASFHINELLEFRNVQLYFEHEMFLENWDQAAITGFTEILTTLDPKIKQYFTTINDQVFTDELSSIEYNYRKAYWALFNNLQVFKKISAPVFLSVLTQNPYHIGYILSHKKIVEHFNQPVRDFLVAYDDSAEIILSAVEEAERFQKIETHFPKALTLDDRREIISRYIESSEPNLNFICLIEHSKDSQQLKLTNKIRLQAKKKSKEINEAILNGSNAAKFGIAVSFDKDQTEIKKMKNCGLDTELSYSRNYLDSLQDDISLFECFVQLFEFLDLQQLITLVAKESEKNVFERIGMSSKNAYPGGIAFNYKARIALIQMGMFDAYLKHRGSSVEKLIDSFIHNRIQKKQGLQNICFNLPDENAGHLSKIRLLAPEMEFLLKQYQCFLEEGAIDFDLLQIGTTQLNFSEIESAAKSKYVYGIETEISRLRYYFFSDQSSLFYVKPYEDQYGNFYDLIVNENVQLKQFENYQRVHINQLVTEGFLEINADNCVQLAKPLQVFVIGLLYKNRVINYWRCDQQIRAAIDEMVAAGWLEFGNGLLTRDEVSYYNYFLNQKEFTNGFNIRNKYLHGTNEHDAGQQQTDYYLLLMLIVLTLFKLDDDLVCGIISNRNQL
ncbi:MAG TPA: hypothetical protein VJ552_04785 [Sediminibacterium sp.]|nr:hypothetical protein [Sediminibacterium sp.]